MSGKSSSKSIPAGVKKPTDRQPKQQDESTITVTAGGREWSIDAAVRDDFELLADIIKLQRGELLGMPSLLERLVGIDQFGEAMNLLRDPETGRGSVASGIEFTHDVIKGLDPNS